MTTPSSSANDSPVDAPGAEAAGAKHGVLGTRLTAIDLIAVGVVSTVVFLFVGGPLWSVARGAEHVARFAWSYALVVPLVVALHAWRARSIADWGSMTAATFIIWSAKFLVTVALYHLLAPGVAAHYVVERAVDSEAIASERAYVGERGFVGATIRGRVVDTEGRPVASAIVWLVGVRRGAAVSDTAGHGELRIEHGVLVGGPVLSHVGDELRVTSTDPGRYILRGNVDGRGALSRVVAPSGTPSIPMRDAGLVRLSCDATRPCGRAWAHVSADPYHTLSTSDGRFEIEHAPTGRHRLTVAAPGPDGALRSVTVDVATGTDESSVVLR